MSTRWDLKVTLEGGKEWEVHPDARDIARFEVHPDGCAFYAYQTRPVTFLRFLAWNAGRRAKLHTLSWEQWADECVEVEDLTPEDAPEADPGSPEASAGA